MQTPILEESEAVVEAAQKAASNTGGARADIEDVLRELQERLEAAAEDAEDLVVAHPFASVAAAFLLGALVAGLISRAR
jgi:ElaB/YqjD/DUF883 family membrane-anchored ribosome-binding protein